MAMLVVPDASPLIALGKIEEVNLLPKLYGRVMITPWVWDEAITKGKARGASDAAYLEKAIQELRFTKVRLSAAERMLVQQLKAEGAGSGEAEVLAIAKRRKALAILDDKNARVLAVGLDIDHIGTAGILYEAFVHSLLSYEKLLELLEKLGKVAWISPELVAGIIRRAREVSNE
ncbi:MAG: hypothetical protein FJ012_06770 [Chloroflexi bacterium]|nr:hypothetical protein [Chloroflexota bacterium]